MENKQEWFHPKTYKCAKDHINIKLKPFFKVIQFNFYQNV